jgi:hypothetical protein
LFKRLEAYVLSAERLHWDDTTVPVLAKGKTDTGLIWIYVRDDKPFGGQSRRGSVLLLTRSCRRTPSGASGTYTAGPSKPMPMAATPRHRYSPNPLG